MGNQYTFTDEDLSLVEKGLYEGDQILEFDNKTYRLILSKEELPETYNLDLFLEENDKLLSLEKEYNKIMLTRTKLFEKIQFNKDVYKEVDIPETQCLGKDINLELRNLLNDSEETSE